MSSLKLRFFTSMDLALMTWPVIGQFSSISSLGNDKDGWLCSEWLQSLSTSSGNMMSSPPLHLVSMFLNLHYGWKLNTDLICKYASFLFWIRILWKFVSSWFIMFNWQVFPTVDNVWHSLEGYPGIRYNLNWVHLLRESG